jgi:hypothetical protein
MANQHQPKITDEQFIDAFNECHGNCALTAQYININYQIPYSRQAVHERARKFPRQVEDCLSLLDDYCEGKIITFAEDETGDIRLRARLYSQVRQGVHRIQRMVIQAKKAGLMNKPRPEQVYKIHNKIYRFGQNNAGDEVQNSALDQNNEIH